MRVSFALALANWNYELRGVLMFNKTIEVSNFSGSANCAADGRSPEPEAHVSSDAQFQSSRKVIEFAVTRVFDVEQAQLAAFSRGVARAAHARQVAMYLAHVACRMSLTDVGRMFGRDRTTVAHACAVIEDERDDPVFDRALDLLEWAVPIMASRASAPMTSQRS